MNGNININDITALVVAIGVIVSAISSIFAAYISTINSKKIQEVHLSVNSRLDQLVEKTESDAFQKGQAAGLNPLPPETPQPKL